MSKRLISEKEKAKEVLESLPEDKIKTALDFLKYLEDRDEWEATYEIMADKKIMKDIEEGKKDIVEGHWEKWDEVKKRLFVKERKAKYRVRSSPRS